jgi:ATP phosphoribosyltransferase
MELNRTEIRLALPSKGVLENESLELLANAGMRVHKPNPRQYRATIPSLPGLVVLFQRPGDIVVSVRDGSVDFGVTGWDIFSERRRAASAGGSSTHSLESKNTPAGQSENASQSAGKPLPFDKNNPFLVLLENLGIGACTLNVIVPESQEKVKSMKDLVAWQAILGRPLRAATKFPVLSRQFFNAHKLHDVQLIASEGTLEIAPTIGYADIIVDLVATGTTLRDNRLKTIEDGMVLQSQGCLIANREAVKQRAEVLAVARQLLEFIVAYQRGSENLSIFANVRGESAESIARQMFGQSVIGGLQGPTISRLIVRDQNHGQSTEQGWFDVHIIVRKDQLARAISELRAVGGSGVVVSPVSYIFEEEPQAYRELLASLKETKC